MTAAGTVVEAGNGRKPLKNTASRKMASSRPRPIQQGAKIPWAAILTLLAFMGAVGFLYTPGNQQADKARQQQSEVKQGGKLDNFNNLLRR